MSILTEYKQAKALAVYGDCCYRNDFQGALAAAESALAKSSDDPLLWWYRAYARDKLGLMESGPTELHSFFAVQPKPARSMAQLIPRRAEWPLDQQVFFSTTVSTASAPVCSLFLELLNCNQSMALCGRLIDLNPAGRDEYLERFRSHLAGLKRELDPALTAGQAAISSKPAQMVNLVRLVHLLQIYEDLLKAEFLAAGQAAAEASAAAGRHLGGRLENGAPGFLEKSTYSGFMAQPMFDGLSVLVEALRAGWSMEFIGPGLLSLKSRPTGSQLAAYATLSVPDKDYFNRLACLQYARQVLDKAYERPPDIRSIDPGRLRPADKRYMDKIGRLTLAMGFRLLGYYRYDLVRSSISATQFTAVFLSPKGDLWVSANRVILDKPGGFMSFLTSILELLRLTQAVSVDSALADGSNISTIRHVANLHFDSPPSMHMKKSPLFASVKKMVNLHRSRAEGIRAGKGRLDYRRPTSINDVIECERRQLLQEKEYRKSLPQFVLDHELKKMMIPSHRQYACKVREWVTNMTGLYDIKYPEG